MRTKLSSTCGIAALGLSSLAMAGEDLGGKDVVVQPAAPPTCPWTLEAALLYLEADSEDSSGYEDQDYETGYRIRLGYQAAGSDTGYRLSYFDFEGTNRGGKGFENGPEIQAIDLEVLRPITLGSWGGKYSFGLRHLEVYEPYSSGADVDYDGIGPTAGIDLTRDLSGPWSMYVNGRVSYLFGDDDEDEAEDDTPVLEIGAGVQRAVSIGNCDGYVRLGLEAHRYFDLAYDSTDGDLFGGVLAFGFGF